MIADCFLQLFTAGLLIIHTLTGAASCLYRVLRLPCRFSPFVMRFHEDLFIVFQIIRMHDVNFLIFKLHVLRGKDPSISDESQLKCFEDINKAPSVCRIKLDSFHQNVYCPTARGNKSRKQIQFSVHLIQKVI